MVGAVAIVITLICLGFQLRYARVTAIDAARHNRASGIREILGFTLMDKDVRTAWDKASEPEWRELIGHVAATHGVSDDEASVVVYQGFQWAWMHWAQFRATRSSQDTAELQNSVRAWYSARPMRTLVTQAFFRDYFEAEFIAFVDDNLEPKD